MLQFITFASFSERALLRERTVLVLTVIFGVSLGGFIWHATRLSSYLIESSALQDAARFSTVLAEFRSLYTSEVVSRVRPYGVEVTHDYSSRDGAIPLPATLSMILGKQIGAKSAGMQVSLYSAYPFPWRQKEGGLNEDFRKAAWRHLKQNSDTPFYRFEEVQGRRSLRYATADLMRAQCVNCHNTHPDTPKTGWKEGDLRGILEVFLPIDRIEAQTRESLRGTFALIAVISLLGLSGLALVLGRLRQSSNELEQQVKERTVDLEATNEQLQHQINERKQAEIALKEAKENAERNAREAEAANHSKSAFLANMSHEIRTPMNAILGFTEILGGMTDDRQQKEYLRSIQLSGKALLTLINDILDLSKVEAGKLELEYAAVNPRQAFEEMEQIFSQKIAEKGLEFLVEIDPGLPEVLILDEVRMRQILVNLIGNAVKFTDKGDVKLSVHEHYPEADHSSLDLIFSVQDTGIGIPGDQRALIFGAFEQQRGQSISEYGGAGLGLAITKRLVEIMGGEIAVTSEVGVGSTFTVQLKNVELATVDKLVEGQEQEIDLDAISFEPATILVVNDVQSNRQLIEGYLSPYHFSLIEAENGQAAVAEAKRHGPDLVLMDMKMPVMDGYEATRRINEEAELKTIPVVALTASAMKPDQEEIARLCDGYLIKPIKKVELIGALAKFLPHSVEASASIEVERSQAAPEDKLAPETLEAETLEKLPELVSILQEHLETQWEGLKQTSLINEVEGFGVQMRDLGNQYNYPPLVAWGERLSTQAQMFELDDLPKTLDEFPRIIEQIQLLTEA